MRLFRPLTTAVIFTTAVALASPAIAQINLDPPQDRVRPASSYAFALPSKDAKINAMIYLSAGTGKHPNVLLLHGIPGNEQNLDLARDLQRAGWNVLTLHYRGSWGSAGDYSITHCLEDAQNALVWLRDPRTAVTERIDSSRIVIVGHSLGGFVAAYTAGHDAQLMGAVLISASRFGGGKKVEWKSRSEFVKIMEDNVGNDAGMRTLGTATAEKLADEAIENVSQWYLPQFAPALASKPLLVLTSNDANIPHNEELIAAVSSQSGMQLKHIHFATDHSYNDQRLTLAATIRNWLSTLPGAPAAARN